MATRDFTRPGPAADAASAPGLGLTLRVPSVAAARPGVPARVPPSARAKEPEPSRGLTQPAPLTRPMPLSQPLTQPMPLTPALPSAPPSRPKVAVAAPTLPHWQVHAGPGKQVILMPGQMSFSTSPAQLRTLLGSCVSITVWHPGRRIGGMCHFLLPQRQRKLGEALDGKYGDEAMEAMVEKLMRTGTKPSEYVAHLYGGADTMPEGNGLKFNVGERNIERGWTLIDHYGFQLEGVDVGEDVPRMVSIDLATGQVDMRRGAGKAPLNPGVATRGPAR